MKKKILSIFAILTIALAGVFVAKPAFAGQCSGGNNDAECNKVCQDTSIPQSVRDAAGCSDTSSDTLPSHLKSIIDAVIALVGIIAVLVIVVGGQRLVTSSGDPQKVNQAKNMILYAVIAVIIASLAYAIINFVADSIGK
jgi:hypothetical protein